MRVLEEIGEECGVTLVDFDKLDINRARAWTVWWCRVTGEKRAEMNHCQ